MARSLLSDPRQPLLFSTASIWEVAIKFARRKPDFIIDPIILRSLLIANGLVELSLTSAHALATVHLSPIHKDPFDRILIAQATVENIQLLTAGATIARYPGRIQRV